MTPEENDRADVLQRKFDAHELVTNEEWEEFYRLKSEARAEQQLPESEISAAYLKQQLERDCEEAGEKALEVAGRTLSTIVAEFFKSLFRRF